MMERKKSDFAVFSGNNYNITTDDRHASKVEFRDVRPQNVLFNSFF